MHDKSVMRRLLLLLFVVVCVAARPRRGRILGGQDAAPGQFPFIVAINDEFGQYCDGAIISPSWILTAAQCVYVYLPSTEIYVGSNLNLANGTAYQIVEAIIHEDYNAQFFQNDIALVRIDGELEFGDGVQPVELGEVAGPDEPCTALGWGATESEAYPENLKYVAVTTLDMDVCQNVSAGFLGYLGSEQVCTVGGAEEGICLGDAGGPLICDGKLAGINSYMVGDFCGNELPDVHTRAGAYAEWIQTHIQG